MTQDPQPARFSLTRVFFTPKDLFPGRSLLIRLGVVVGLFAAVILLMWVDRDGLQDQLDGEITFADVVYFSMITITTVGYGDIIPITPRARLIDAVVLTPIRFFIWFLFLGTAYQLTVRKYMEEYRMATFQSQLKDHVIICGLGHTGLSAVKELLAKGHDPARMVVVEPNEERVRRANEEGVVGIRGSATQENILQQAKLDTARALVVSAGRDDTNTLILLTARHLNDTIRIIVSAKEEENIKLFRQGGANSIIAPASFGGYLVAASIDHGHCVEYFEDLLTSGGRVNLMERAVEPHEVGKTAAGLRPDVLLRVYREGAILSLWDFQGNEPLHENDTLVLLHRVSG